jgi:fumarate hydratase subunit beta
MRLEAPLSESQVRDLRVGDIVRVSGTVLIGRDEVHLRALEWLEEGRPLPVETAGAILFHCGPIVRKVPEGWEMVAAGPTTSSRMNALEPEFIEAFGIRAIIGKGGMSRPTLEAMRRFGCVYLAFTGGAAVLAAEGIRKIRTVEWLDLGMPEALWVVEAEELGPMIVAMDAHGSSLYDRVGEQVKGNLSKVRERLSLD